MNTTPLYFTQDVNKTEPQRFLWKWDGEKMFITRNQPNDWEASRTKPRHFSGRRSNLTPEKAKELFPNVEIV